MLWHADWARIPRCPCTNGVVRGILPSGNVHSVKLSEHVCVLSMCQGERRSTPSLSSRVLEFWVVVKV